MVLAADPRRGRRYLDHEGLPVKPRRGLSLLGWRRWRTSPHRPSVGELVLGRHWRVSWARGVQLADQPGSLERGAKQDVELLQRDRLEAQRVVDDQRAHELGLELRDQVLDTLARAADHGTFGRTLSWISCGSSEMRTASGGSRSHIATAPVSAPPRAPTTTCHVS